MSTEIPLLDIKLLRLLNQLYATRRVTRAADALDQSQPRLARLRKELGDALVVRSADALMPAVREMLAGLQRPAQSPAPFDAATTEHARKQLLI